MIPTPTGIYGTTATVTPACIALPRRTDVQSVFLWGTPGHGEGQVHLPHRIAFDPEGKLTSAERGEPKGSSIFADGAYLGMWTGMGGPEGHTRGKDGTLTCRQEKDGSLRKLRPRCERNGSRPLRQAP